jgi:hypothetical protein
MDRYLERSGMAMFAFGMGTPPAWLRRQPGRNAGRSRRSGSTCFPVTRLGLGPVN